MPRRIKDVIERPKTPVPEPVEYEHNEMRHTMIPRPHSMAYHHRVHTMSDRVALSLVMVARTIANLMFQKRFGHRAVVLETIAAVPGMVGGLLQHLRTLRLLRDDRGFIKTLLDEAENERVHLLVYGQVACPNVFERTFIMIAQFVFYNVYFILYLISPRTAHRTVGYLEEEAVHSYTAYLEMVEGNPRLNVKAPELAIEYWGLSSDARLADVIRATREDEIHHRDVNHGFADRLS
jgi:ubiquinol oxidase